MKDFNSFEDYIEGKKDSFSENEPAFGHFNRFDEKLNTLHQENQPTKKHNNTFIYAVASACLVLISMVVYPFLETNKTNTSQHSQNIEQVNRSLSNDTRQSLKNPVVSASYSADDDFEDMLEQITQLEMEYVQLKQYYNSRNHCDKVLAEMKKNLETRLTILEKINNGEDSLKIIQFVHQEYMLNRASDCFGYPVNQYKNNKDSHNMVALAY